MGNPARGVAAAVAGVLLTACGGEGGMKLPSYGDLNRHTFVGPTRAQLGGDPVTGCVWLEAAFEGERMATLWPRDYRVRFDPIRIYDARGRVVMREGVMHDFSGQRSTVAIHKVPRGCRTGERAFHVSPLRPEAERSPR